VDIAAPLAYRPRNGARIYCSTRVSKLTKPGRVRPESPGRVKAVAKALSNDAWTNRLVPIAVRHATVDELCLVHDPDYVELVRREVKEQGVRRLSTGDTDVSRESYDVALTATGGGLNAIDEVLEGRLANAFCVVRPGAPCHGQARHGVLHLQSRGRRGAVCATQAWGGTGGDRRLDVHHGNGTQDIFYEDGSVFYFSTHQHPWYPGTGLKSETGEGPGKGTTMNCPLPAGTMMEAVRDAFRNRFLPAMASFPANLILISAGFDGRHGDPLGGFLLRDEDFAELDQDSHGSSGAELLGPDRLHAGGRLRPLWARLRGDGARRGARGDYG